MKSIIYAIVLITSSIGIANAKLPAKCIDRLISKSEGMLEKVEIAINNNDQRPVNDHTQIKKYWGEFSSYVKGQWTQDCYAAAAENKNKYIQYYNKKARPIMHKAIARQSELCSSITNTLIEAGMKEINTEIARNSTSGAEGRISALEFKLKKKPIVLNCPPVKDKITSLLNDELPMLRDNLNNMNHINRISYSYKNVVGRWNDAQVAFQNKTLAPNFGSQSKSDYKTSLGNCLDAISGLEKSNFDKSKVITKYKGKNISLVDVKKDCSKVDEYGLDNFFEKTKDHNDEYWSKWKDNWKDKYIKGDAMQKVFTNNKNISPVVEDLGKTINWTYRSYTTNHLFHDCKIYSFDSSGKSLISLKKVLCE